ncbi:MAG: ABC transporter permease [Bacteroidetes bacterium]|nr:MAG: ABC transporter permease [Bacteroidota bacterium]
MRTIRFLLFKEFRQIFRNRAILPLIFVVPIVQLIILANAATYEIKGLKLYWVDHDLSASSRLLYSKFEASSYFEITGTGFDKRAGEAALMRDQADILLEVPSNFERDLMREGSAGIQLLANAVDGVKAGLGTAYAQAVIGGMNVQLLSEQRLPALPTAGGRPAKLDITFSNWFNPHLDYKTFMVPGILALLVTLIGSFLSSMNIVREKELGTIEQINVTPIRKYQFIVGKLMPFWIIALFELAFGLVIAKLLYDIPFVGSLWLLFGFAGLYLLVVLGIGLFISTITETQQQAMFVSWFIMMIFVLMSGMFTAIENMPGWAQQITYLNPIRYFIEVIRMVMLKGASFNDIQWHVGVMAGYALVINALAVWNYRKRLS